MHMQDNENPIILKIWVEKVENMNIYNARKVMRMRSLGGIPSFI